jgi:hypothetical protein
MVRAVTQAVQGARVVDLQELFLPPPLTDANCFSLFSLVKTLTRSSACFWITMECDIWKKQTRIVVLF